MVAISNTMFNLVEYKIVMYRRLRYIQSTVEQSDLSMLVTTLTHVTEAAKEQLRSPELGGHSLGKPCHRGMFNMTTVGVIIQDLEELFRSKIILRLHLLNSMDLGMHGIILYTYVYS